MPLSSAKRSFLSYELGLLTLKAALSTRDKEWPIYSPVKKDHQRGAAKKAFREILIEIEQKYSSTGSTESAHVLYIESVADRLSDFLKSTLHQSRFRIGVAQKMVNLHLKYLWVAGIIQEPVHCPIDGIIRDLAGIQYDWTRSDSIEEYKLGVAALKTVAGTKSLSHWELEEFRRRAEQ
jgi:hypothetical protein